MIKNGHFYIIVLTLSLSCQQNTKISERFNSQSDQSVEDVGPAAEGNPTASDIIVEQDPNESDQIMVPESKPSGSTQNEIEVVGSKKISLFIENGTLSFCEDESPLPDDSIRFVRESPAYYQAADGSLKLAMPHEPRVTYDDQGVLLGVMFEKPAENLLTHSENYSEWSPRDNTVVTANVGNSPDGAPSATRLFMPEGGGTGLTSPDFAIPMGETITFSFWAKANGESIQLDELDLTLQPDGIEAENLDLQIPNAWTRISITGTAVADEFSVLLNNFSEGYLDCLIWGMQLEVGEQASSYIPTADNTATRGMEYLELEASSWLSREGTMVFDLIWQGNNYENTSVMALHDGATTLINLASNSTGLTQVMFPNQQLVGSSTWQSMQEKSIAFSYGMNGSILLDEGDVVSQSAFAIEKIDGTLLTLGGGSDRAFSGYLKSFQFISRFSDADQLANLVD